MTEKTIEERFAELETRLRNDVLAAVDRRFDELSRAVRLDVVQGLEAQSKTLQAIHEGVLALRDRLESRGARGNDAAAAVDVRQVADANTVRGRETRRRNDRSQRILHALYELKPEAVAELDGEAQALVKDGGRLVERYILRENDLGDMLPEEFDGLMDRLELVLKLEPSSSPRTARERRAGGALAGAFLTMPTGRGGRASGR